MTTVRTGSSDNSSDVEAGTAQLNLDWEAKFNSLKRRDKTVTLEWQNITFSVKDKEILHGVSGEASPGDLVAILGPSGSGKSTLLNILAGRVTGSGKGKRLRGKFLANGEVVAPSKFRENVAYVVQDDALFPTHTAREALTFSAALRLPRTFPKHDREELVNDMIESLGLVGCQHTMIGNELIRGVSGGERKRVAIGVELVSSPAVLFLDEPTSGLDSYSAWKVLKILQAISATRTTILCSIHQPSSEVFNQFSAIILLCKGNIIYQGSIEEVDPVFRAYGLGVPKRTNVADHVILLTQTIPLEKLPQDNGNVRRRRGATRLVRDETGEEKTPATEDGIPPIEDGLMEIPTPHDGEQDEEENKESKRKSVLSRLSMRGAMMLRSGRSPAAVDTERAVKLSQIKREPTAGMLVQTYYLTIRECQGLMRDRAGLIARFGTTFSMAIMFALIFLNSGDQSRADYVPSSLFGAVVMMVVGSMFLSALPSILTFPLERVIFLRERGTNTYATVPYFVAKLVVELPLTLLVTFLTVLIDYFAMKMVGNIAYITLALFLLAEASISIATLVGAVVSSPKQAMEVAPMVMVPPVLFMGFFIRIDQIPIPLRYLQYLSHTKYAFNLVVLTVFDPDLAATPTTKAAWLELRQSNDIYLNEAWFYVLILVALFVIFRLIAMMILGNRAVRFD